MCSHFAINTLSTVHMSAARNALHRVVNAIKFSMVIQKDMQQSTYTLYPRIKFCLAIVALQARLYTTLETYYKLEE